jgi:DNA transformation protein and related proteins
MAVSDEFRAHVRDLFAGIGPVDVRRMFGGAGIYLDDACFAIVLDGAIFMRGDEALGPDLEAAGGDRWVYLSPTGRPTVMPYWRLPESALDDPDEAAAWARRALVPAEKAAAEKRAARNRKKARARK